MEVNYLVATEKDIEFIAEVYQENIEALHGVPRTYEVWKELFSDKSSIYYIVYTQAPAAWFRVDFSEDVLWLGMLQVKPKNQRKGIGRYILSVAEKLAKEKGLSKIGIHTTQDNVAAQGLYLSEGYLLTEIGPCTTADGQERIGYTFQKELQDRF